MSTPDHGLDLGALDLVSRNGRAGTYWYSVVAEGFSPGQAGSELAIAKSLLVDGERNRRVRHTNRSVTFDVIIGGVDMGAVAVGETMLALELAKYANTFTWTPPNDGIPTVFLMVVGEYSEVFYDLDQALRNERRFRVTLECLPYTRSATAQTFTWSGPATATVTALGGGNFTTTFVASNFLRVRVGSTGSLTSIGINGSAFPTATMGFQTSGTDSVYMLPTERYLGQTVTVTFTSDATPTARIVGYANRGVAVAPIGIDVINVLGSARAPFRATFTAPSGGAFVYTGPDPNLGFRVRGLAEKVVGHVVVGAGGSEIAIGGNIMYLPEGDWVQDLGVADAQPIASNPNGIFPTVNHVTGRMSFPADDLAAATIFTSTGAKVLESEAANLLLQSDYSGDAKYHMPHALHPARSGFAVLDQNGAPITTTVTYYPCWMGNAAL